MESETNINQKTRILVIDNQWSHFEKIYNNLKNANDLYEIFPTIPEDPESKQKYYIDFIEKIHICIDKRYGNYPSSKKSIRNIALLEINNIIETQRIDLIIMDHILGGPQGHPVIPQTGIDLAELINDERKNKNMPILPVLFLSTTRQDDKTRMVSYKTYKSKYPTTEWCHKGYADQSILNKEYFNQNVLLKIQELYILPLIKDVRDKAQQICKVAIDYNNKQQEYTKKLLIKELEIFKYNICEELKNIIINHCKLKDDYLDSWDKLIIFYTNRCEFHTYPLLGKEKNEFCPFHNNCLFEDIVKSNNLFLNSPKLHREK